MSRYLIEPDPAIYFISLSESYSKSIRGNGEAKRTIFQRLSWSLILVQPVFNFTDEEITNTHFIILRVMTAFTERSVVRNNDRNER